ncbi:hypothetical protein [Pontibacter sp. G13]|uniref:hypothetical protein n=1 Tax=Pontibacter sp. G13 TaxID=3074898 RepID=UPI00288B8733|nr:hypothetical protein [Pontibacter sp. G13]WNJ18595.1 hypothetical protein RJD25_27380 [Pontibacter sp. G13]
MSGIFSSPATNIARGIAICLLCLSFSSALGQSSEEIKKLQLSGYVKFLETYSVPNPDLIGGLKQPIIDHEFHNRLDLTYDPSERWNFSISARNRLFYGDQVRTNPNFADLVVQNNGLLDLSVVWFDNNYWALTTVFDRAYIRYEGEKWEITAGRQRINWGINTIWNPNDLFNAFNYFDFDYEERPGTDAVRVLYYTGVLSHVELAIAPGDADTSTTVAALYRFNKKAYDIQFLGGYFEGDIAIGGGWDGAIGGAGFKGEVTGFLPLDGRTAVWDTVASLSATASVEYMFGVGSGLFTTFSVLYNSNGNRVFNTSGAGDVPGPILVTAQPSARNLFPAQWTFFGVASGSFSPIFTGGIGIMYGLDGPMTLDHQLIINPSLTYSIKENWDLDGIGQLYFAQLDGSFSPLSSSIFVRLKWSF